MDLMQMINAAGGIGAIAKEVGVSEPEAQSGAAALLPAILSGFKQHAGAAGGLGGLVSMFGNAGGAGLLENLVGNAPTNASLGNQILGQIFGSKDVSRSIAQKAAAATGLDASVLQKMLPLLTMAAAGLFAKQAGSGQAGAGGLLGGLLGGSDTLPGLGKLLDQNGDGSPLDELGGLAGKLFGR